MTLRVPRLLFALFCAAALTAGVTVAFAQSQAQQPYHVIAKWKIGGVARWDYLSVDPATHRLFISHGTQVDAVDTSTGKVVGSITGLQGSHGIAYDATGKYGYISDGSGVVVFDRATLAKVTTVAVGGADGIIYEPATKTIWSWNRGSAGATATAIDTATQKLATTINTQGRLEAAAVDGKGNVYSNIGGDIVRIDAKTGQITAQWKTGCEDASGLAADPEGNRIFQACDGKKMFAADLNTGKVLATSEIGDGPDSAGWSAKYHLAFASTRDGLLSVIDATKAGYPTIEKLPTMSGARTMTYDPATDRVYTVSAERDPKVKEQQGPPQGGPPQGQGQGGQQSGQQGPPQGQGQGGPGGPPQGQGQGAPSGQGGPGGPGGASPYLADSFTVIVIGR
jgi:DNA-binding beta-propeller fold protein YncE